MALAEIARGREFSFWRFGVAVGLAASVKYTAVYTLVPMCFLAIALRMPLKRALLAAGVAVVIAGPWFVRNWVMFGNPLFPVEIRAPPSANALAPRRKAPPVGGTWSWDCLPVIAGG